MLKGFIDAVYSSGAIHGWACDTKHPARPLDVSIREKNVEIAMGLANGYRNDLAKAGLNGGWCKFSLRSLVPVSKLRGVTLALIHQPTGLQIVTCGPVSITDDRDTIITSIDLLTAADETTLSTIDELEGCEYMLDAFVELHGAEVFARFAYVYVLRRPADESGLKTYSGAISRGALSPYEMLRHLALSAEYLSSQHRLTAPTNSAFPFRVT